MNPGAIRAISLSNVIRDVGTSEYQIRHIFRWYSRQFHTPLHQVQDIPMRDVLVAYYETVYEDMDEEDILKEAQELCMSDKAIKENKEKKDSDDASDWSFSERQSKEEKKKKEIEEAREEVNKKTEELKQVLGRAVNGKCLPERVSIKFDENMDEKDSLRLFE